jgi:hypothetical protein
MGVLVHEMKQPPQEMPDDRITTKDPQEDTGYYG